jgi:hypothetical protein
LCGYTTFCLSISRLLKGQSEWCSHRNFLQYSLGLFGQHDLAWTILPCTVHTFPASTNDFPYTQWLRPAAPNHTGCDRSNSNSFSRSWCHKWEQQGQGWLHRHVICGLSQKPQVWFHTLLSPSWKASLFLNMGPHIFICTGPHKLWTWFSARGKSAGRGGGWTWQSSQS